MSAPREDCVFCERIRRGDASPTTVRGIVAFEPLNPVTPGHLLFVPMHHVASAKEGPGWAALTVEAAAASAFDEANIITSSGPNATQTIGHLHVHLVPRRPGDGLHLPWTGQIRE
jgi:histidine triad (HIT) family protein